MALDMDATEQAILEFWFGRPGDPDYGRARAVWFKKPDPAFDAELARRLGGATARAAEGALDHWQEDTASCLALILLLDQLPRNLYRNDTRAYAQDAKARAVAGVALERGFDRCLGRVQQLFLYLPFEHSEDLADQRRSVALFAELGDDDEAQAWLNSAQKHFQVIERFGRFPHRNSVLGRRSSPAEEAFLKQPGSSFA